MTIEDRPDPDEYTPGPDSLTAPEEYEPEASIEDATIEADPADVADQLIDVPDGDDDEVDAEPTIDA